MNDINAVISSDRFLLSWQKWALIASSPRQSQDTASVPKTVNLSWVFSDGCLAEVPMRSHFVLGVARGSEKEGCHGCYCTSWRSGSSTEFKRSFSYTHSSTSLAEPALCKCFHNSMCLCGSLVLHYYPVQALRRDETLRFCILPESRAGSSNNEEACRNVSVQSFRPEGSLQTNCRELYRWASYLYEAWVMGKEEHATLFSGARLAFTAEDAIYSWRECRTDQPLIKTDV